MPGARSALCTLKQSGNAFGESPRSVPRGLLIELTEMDKKRETDIYAGKYSAGKLHRAHILCTVLAIYN
jgi:hypothetical protein